MATYAFTPTDTITFGGLDSATEQYYSNVHVINHTINIASIVQPSNVRALSSIVVPGQPVFSQMVSKSVTSSLNFSLTSSITLSHSVVKNNNYRFSLTHHLIPS